MRRYILLLGTVLLTNLLAAQAVSDKGHFLYEPESWEPPTRDLIGSFEGQPAEPFLANDINGIERYLPSYKGQKVVLWFWDTESRLAVSQIAALNEIDQMEGVQVISFARKPSSDLTALMADSFGEITFPVIGNGDMFGQMAYGADLGYPRFFIIDAEGIIRVVLPAEAFAGESDVTTALTAIINGL